LINDLIASFNPLMITWGRTGYQSSRLMVVIINNNYTFIAGLRHHPPCNGEDARLRDGLSPILCYARRGLGYTTERTRAYGWPFPAAHYHLSEDSMKSLKEQTEAKVEAGRQAKPDFMKNVDEIIENAKALHQGANALSVGEKAPGFALPDAAGQSVSLEELLESGPVVVTFYRGDWCPYCSLQLRALNERLDDIRAHGAQLVAISPQVPDDSLSATEIDEMQFHVLSDQDAEVASRYGVAWKVPDYLMEHMRVDRELDLDAINNGDGSVLPIPATFVIAQDRTVSWRHVDVDYRIRSEPEDIVNALKALA